MIFHKEGPTSVGGTLVKHAVISFKIKCDKRY